MGQCSACGSKATTPVATNAAIAKTNTNKTATHKCSPNPFMPSCDTQEKLAQCLKQVLCDVLRCLDDAICPTGNNNEMQSITKDSLTNCLKTAVCSFARCVPDALCPPAPMNGNVDQLACDFAVEQKLSVQEQG